MFSDLIDKLYNFIDGIPFDGLVWYVWGSYAAIFVLVFVLTLAFRRLKTVSKRPFLCLTNAYAGVNLALYLSECGLAQSVMITALFWTAGYILFGLLCAVSRQPKPEKREAAAGGTVVTGLPVQIQAAPPKPVKQDIPAAKNNVRLEHAASVTEKLLSKSLGKTDRQELEKLKNTLAVLRIKGTLSPAESEILNENFNTLLKLMAKYNV
jgi:hypothetical protein